MMWLGRFVRSEECNLTVAKILSVKTHRNTMFPADKIAYESFKNLRGVGGRTMQEDDPLIHEKRRMSSWQLC